MINPLTTFRSLDWVKKGITLLVLLGVMMVVGYKAYGYYQLKLAHKNEQVANELRDQAKAAITQATAFKAQADDLVTKLAKSNAKVAKLEAERAKIVIPEKPVIAPSTVKLTLEELQKMGLSLVIKPSTQLAPSVAGITGEDASKVWFWGKEAIRVPALESALSAETDLAGALDKSLGVATKLADTRTKEADAAFNAANLSQKEAVAIRSALDDTKKALVAEQRKKLLYSIGALGLGYVVARR